MIKNIPALLESTMLLQLPHYGQFCQLKSSLLFPKHPITRLYHLTLGRHTVGHMHNGKITHFVICG